MDLPYRCGGQVRPRGLCGVGYAYGEYFEGIVPRTYNHHHLLRNLESRTCHLSPFFLLATWLRFVLHCPG